MQGCGVCRNRLPGCAFLPGYFSLPEYISLTGYVSLTGYSSLTEHISLTGCIFPIEYVSLTEYVISRRVCISHRICISHRAHRWYTLAVWGNGWEDQQRGCRKGLEPGLDVLRCQPLRCFELRVRSKTWKDSSLQVQVSVFNTLSFLMRCMVNSFLLNSFQVTKSNLLCNEGF